ncbi:MAG: FadR/GntR family transcriptional regulator [Gemmatimonadetes bacterium]|nr:FadR/GntR family transcriptional regulator [Gemmatimonadota bacterium]
MRATPRALRPLTKTRLHEEIMEQIKDRIISGDLPPGAALPPERVLAEQLGVNRTTVREALHKLESMGLIEIKHGSGVFVRNYLESGGLELARHLLVLDGQANMPVFMNLHQLRRLLLPEMSADAAAHRSARDLDELQDTVFAHDDMPLAERDWRVHNIIARASGNVLAVLLINAFTQFTRDAIEPYFIDEANRRRSMKFHRDICAAIEKQDGSKARRVMAEVLAFAEVQSLKAIEPQPKSKAKLTPKLKAKAKLTPKPKLPSKMTPKAKSTRRAT